MPALPKISVVTPSYQQGDTLEDTIRSVLGQEYPNLEYIVCDGGSTDQSVSILTRYSDEIAWWVSEPDGGQTAGIKKGFDRATGEVMCWLNSDDEFAPGALMRVGHYFSEHPHVKFLYGDAELTDKDGVHLSFKRETPFSWFVWLWWYNFLPQPSTFWRAALYRQAGGLDAEYSLAMDADLWERMASISKPVHVPEMWSRIRIYPEQRNQAFRQQSDVEDSRIRERHLGREVKALEWQVKHVLAGSVRMVMRALCIWGSRARG